jgi:hypothetical protein
MNLASATWPYAMSVPARWGAEDGTATGHPAWAAIHAGGGEYLAVADFCNPGPKVLVDKVGSKNFSERYLIGPLWGALIFW